MFGAKIYDGPPAGYITQTQLAALLDMSRQNLTASGLVDAISSWKIGRVRLYRDEDANQLTHLLFVRRGLIALGVLPENHPLADEGLFVDAVIEGEYDTLCPNCGKVAVRYEDRVWCPSELATKIPEKS